MRLLCPDNEDRHVDTDDQAAPQCLTPTATTHLATVTAKPATEPPGHSHGVAADTDRRYLTGALALIVAFLITEVVVGIIAESLALISDAGHMLTDAASIVLALIAIRLSAKPAQGRWTYGYKRAEILSAGQRTHPAAVGNLVHL